MGAGHFFAVIARMKYINRWGLMRNTRDENLSEHSLEVSMLAHGLALIRNRRFSGSLNAERAALLGLYHDASEILTGDLPTPVKYYNPGIKEAYSHVEEVSKHKLLLYLPEDLRSCYRDIFFNDPADHELWKLVKAADKLSALIKCIEESKAGNKEFTSAESSLRQTLEEMNMPEVNVFMEEFLPSYKLTLDEQD